MDYSKLTDEEIYEKFCNITRQRVSQLIQQYERAGDGGTVGRLYAARERMKERKWMAKYGQGSRLVKKAQSVWRGINSRCGNSSGRYPAYEDCTNGFENFMEFLNWCAKQEHFGEDGFEVDKDILLKGSRTYSPETCCVVPNEVNQVLAGCVARPIRGRTRPLPIGVSYHKENDTYLAQMTNLKSGESRYLGCYETPEEAFQVYKSAKEQRLREVAERHKNVIDPRVYAALVNWKVEPTD